MSCENETKIVKITHSALSLYTRDLLNADLATKPWLKFRSISRTDNLAKVREDASQAFPLDEGTFTATPAKVMTSDDLSRSTSSNEEQSETTLNDSYDD